MKNILMIGSALMAGYAGFAVLPAQEPTLQRQDAKGTVVAAGRARNNPVIGAPFSAVAVTESTQTLADGNRIVRTSQEKLYRDSQGRERGELGAPTVSVLGQQVAVTNVAISDPVAGVSFTLNPKAHSAQKRSVANNMMAQFQRAVIQFEGDARVVKEQLPPTTIEGVYAQGTRTTSTIPAGKVGNERDILVIDEVWYSPDLQMNVMTKHSDPRGGETILRLTNIDRSEPDPALFQIPVGYTVTEPRPLAGRGAAPPAPPPAK